MSKIEINDSMQDVVVKMSAGNPGAIQAVMELITKSTIIDPDSSLGPMGLILMLDTLEIYGSDIYILYNDKCQRDVRKLFVLIRACQLGTLSQDKLVELSKDQCGDIDLNDDEFNLLDDDVCQALPNFQRGNHGI